MSKWYYELGVVCLTAVMISFTGSQEGSAAEQEYVSKARVKTLYQAPLAGVEGKEVIIKHFQIPPEFVGHTFAVHNGRNFIVVFVSEAMDGHRLGEFAPTRTYRGHSKK